jgi:hypothetical protein
LSIPKKYFKPLSVSISILMRKGGAIKRLRPVFKCMALFLVMALLASARLIAAEITLGERSGYRIELQLIVDTHRRPQPGLASHLVDMISQRVDATLSPFWDLTIHVPQGKMRQRLRLLLDSTGPLPVAKDKALPWEDFRGGGLDGDELGEGRSVGEKLPDKRMFLSVTALPAGFRLRCCEWDGYVHRWGTIQQRMVSQRSQLAENGFQILREVFAPLAVVHIQAMDDGGRVDGQALQDQPDRTTRDKQVLLQVKGNQLVRESVGQLFSMRVMFISPYCDVPIGQVICREFRQCPGHI